MKCVGLYIDGARAMCDKSSSVMNQMLKIQMHHGYYNIHMEVLISKHLTDYLKNVLRTSMKKVDFIKIMQLQSHFLELLIDLVKTQNLK